MSVQRYLEKPLLPPEEHKAKPSNLQTLFIFFQLQKKKEEKHCTASVRCGPLGIKP